MYILLGVHVIKTVYLVFLLFSQTGADNDGNADCLFLSHLTGEDSLYCGSHVKPCRTLPRALRLVRDGGRICLDGRDSESNPYGCLTLDDGPNEVERVIIQKSLTIQGQFAEAHISCKNPNDLIFATLGIPGRLKITLSNLVFHNTRVILRYVCAFNVVVTKCRFINCPYGVGMRQEESFTPACQTSTLLVTDSEFWYNYENSIIVNLSNEFFNFTISRCLFQGRKGRFNVTSDDRNTTGAVYIISRIQKSALLKRIRVVGSVTDSIFRELGHRDNGFAFSVRIEQVLSEGNVTLLNTSFLANENSVFANGRFGLQLTNVTINSSNGYAIAAIGPPKITPKALGIKVLIHNCFLADNRVGIRMSTGQKLTMAVTDSEFWYNYENSIIVNLSNEFFNFTISRCLFQGRKGRFNVTSDDRNTTGAVYIISRIQKSALLKRIRVVGSVTDSLFRELGHEDNGFAFSVRIEQVLSEGNVTLLNTSFLTNENSVFVHGGLGLQLTNVTINSSYGYAIAASGPPKIIPKALGINVFLDNCFLADNRVGIRMSTTSCLYQQQFCSTSDQTLVITNSHFIRDLETRDSFDAIRFAIQRPKQIESDETEPDQQYYLSTDFEAKLILENVTFQELHGSALSVEADKNVHGLISVKNCKFVNNSQFVYRMVERATVRIEIKDEQPPKCSRQQEQSKSSELIWRTNFRLPVIFEDSVFEGNVGVTGALNFMNGNVTIKNCRFKNNEGLTSGGHVFMKTGYGRLNIVNSSFLQTGPKLLSKRKQQVSSYACFLRSESAGQVTIQSSSFSASVDREFYDPLFAATKCSSINIDSSSTFTCPAGRRMKREEIAKRAGFEIVKDSETCWTNVKYLKLFCEKCPDGFFTLQRGMTNGLNIDKTTECQKCPYGATCANGRIVSKENFWGFILSKKPSSLQFIPCPLEYCETPTHSKHAYNDCHGNRSGVLCGRCTRGYTEVLYSTSCRKNEDCYDHWFWVASFVYIMLFAVYIIFKPPIFSVLYRQTVWFRKAQDGDQRQTPQNVDNNCDEHDAGYLKIVFYFYQVAELVMVESPENALHMVPFIPPVIALFNFQVKTMDGSIGCPFPGLNAVTKELFTCLKFLATLLSIGVIYGIHRGISKCFYLANPSLSLYLAAALETLLLGYETLADTTLKLMHCVPIGHDWRLFVDGNIQCWQWWQYLFIVFIVVFVIPLVLVLFWGSLKLSKDKVSAREFLTSCAFPLPFLLIWILRYWKKTRNGNQSESLNSNSKHTEEIKRVLHDPFRPSSDGEHGTLYWESVLTGRRLILLTIHTFVTDPMIRFLCLDCACFVILLHHVSSRPFRERKANICESVSLVSLVVICTFNLAVAIYISEGLEPSGPSQNVFHTLQWIEIVLLGLLPAAACILVVFAALSQVVRVLYHCIRILRKCATSLVPSLGSSSRSPQLVINWDDEELDIVS